MPDVTQSRVLPASRFEWSHLKKESWDTGDVVANSGNHWGSEGFETTTSYRSKRGETQQTEDDRLSGEDMRKNLSVLRRQHRMRYDNGHNFSTEKKLATYAGTRVHVVRTVDSRTRYTYTGNILPYVAPSPALWPDLSSVVPSVDKINADGRKAIEMTIPTSPEVKLANLLLELREKLPTVPSSRLTKDPSIRNAGSEYLNVEFGWRPLAGDIEKLASQVLNAAKVMRQYRRDSGSQIRRGCTIANESSVVDLGLYGPGFNLPQRLYGTQFYDVNHEFFASRGGVRVWDSISSRSWFKGAYTYHLAEGHDFFSKAEMYEQLANQLLGTRINASTVYELTPWSWLFDWVSDFGTFVSNVSALSEDSLVLRYGYVMHTTSITRFRKVVDVINASGVKGTVVAESFHQNLRKTRTRSTPYGFGINVESLSPRRWAILGALGMTKAPGKLR